MLARGRIAEQFVGQHLQTMLSDKPNRELNYWLREGRTANAELDFVIGWGEYNPHRGEVGCYGNFEVSAPVYGEFRGQCEFRGQYIYLLLFSFGPGFGECRLCVFGLPRRCAPRSDEGGSMRRGGDVHDFMLFFWVLVSPGPAGHDMNDTGKRM